MFCYASPPKAQITLLFLNTYHKVDLWLKFHHGVKLNVRWIMMQCGFNSPTHCLCCQIPVPKMSVHVGQSLHEGPHILPTSVFYRDHNLYVESNVFQFQTPFCSYATFINETPGEFESYLSTILSSCWRNQFMFYDLSCLTHCCILLEVAIRWWGHCGE